jgi:hypothetical protein
VTLIGGPRVGGRSVIYQVEQSRLIQCALDAIHTLSLMMAVGPIAAIILVLWLIRPTDAR